MKKVLFEKQSIPTQLCGWQSLNFTKLSNEYVGHILSLESYSSTDISKKNYFKVVFSQVIEVLTIQNKKCLN